MLQGECDPCGVDVFGVRFPGALPPVIQIHPLRGCFSLALYIICENGLRVDRPLLSKVLTRYRMNLRMTSGSQ